MPEPGERPAAADARAAPGEDREDPGRRGGGRAVVRRPPARVAPGRRRDRQDPVRVFAFDRRYQQHYPSIRIAAGSLRPGSAAAERGGRARARRRSPARRSQLQPARPARKPLSLPVSGVADLVAGQAALLQPQAPASSRTSSTCRTRSSSAPRRSSARSSPRSGPRARRTGRALKSLPGAGGRRARRPIAAALGSRPRRSAQTKAIARSIDRIAPGQDYLIDNISNTLAGRARTTPPWASGCSSSSACPGVLLAAFLAAYAGSILASTQRRERANLRIRGAHRGHLLRMLALQDARVCRRRLPARGRARLPVGDGDPGPDTLFEAAASDLVASALIAVGVGMLTTALALYIPGRRSLSREISQERREMAAGPRARLAAPAARLRAARGGRDRRGDRLSRRSLRRSERVGLAGRGGVAAVASAARAAGRLAWRHAALGSRLRRRSRRASPCPPRPASAR